MHFRFWSRTRVKIDFLLNILEVFLNNLLSYILHFDKLIVWVRLRDDKFDTEGKYRNIFLSL